jgi:hypothetical protein
LNLKTAVDRLSLEECRMDIEFSTSGHAHHLVRLMAGFGQSNP